MVDSHRVHVSTLCRAEITRKMLSYQSDVGSAPGVPKTHKTSSGGRLHFSEDADHVHVALKQRYSCVQDSPDICSLLLSKLNPYFSELQPWHCKQ